MGRPAAALALAGAGFMPGQASSVAEGVDGVFRLIFWVSAAFFALIVVSVVLFVARYRARPSRPEPEPSPSHHLRLELAWTLVPLALVLVIFVAGTRTYLRMVEPEPQTGASPLRVKVTARRWSWWFDHPGGKGARELHLVAGRPAELVLASADVIHSLFVPAFRLKQDAVPGRLTRMVVTPTLAGSFPILCAEYCGTNHSRMGALAVVHADQASFDAWAREGLGDASVVALGQRLFAERGCIGCHTVDGSPGVGPSVKHLFGREERLEGGATVRVDDGYLRESILQPAAKITAGFPNLMPPIPVDERELQALIAFIQSLKETP
ncbi:MAG: c-type cytochrome [Anaeromyxobacteraceae bacterium]